MKGKTVKAKEGQDVDIVLSDGRRLQVCIEKTGYSGFYFSAEKRGEIASGVHVIFDSMYYCGFSKVLLSPGAIPPKELSPSSVEEDSPLGKKLAQEKAEDDYLSARTDNERREDFYSNE